MNDDPEVSIVVPVWGPQSITDACLAALCSTTPIDTEIVFIDNTGLYHGNDDSRLIVHHNHANIGCTGAKIRGEYLSNGRVVIFMDCDTEAQPGWLEPLLRELEDPEVGMVGPKLIYPDGRIQCAGIRTWHGQGQAGGENIRTEHPTEDVDGCTGACMAVRREVLDQTGGHDPKWWGGYDDVDLSLMTKEAGWRIRYAADSVVIHKESATGPERSWYMYETLAYMDNKWGNR